MLKRPILVAVIGYLIGIIMGLYFKGSIVLFYLPIIVIYFIIKKFFISNSKQEFKLLSLKRYFRYIKIVLNESTIICIIIFSIISNSIIIIQNQKYENLYKDINNVKGEGVIVSNKEEKEFYNIYKIKILKVNKSEKYKDTYLYLKIDKKSTEILEYGDKVKFEGEFIEPSEQRNYDGFDYKEYLKTLKVYGTIKIEEVKVLEKESINFILGFANKISIKIKQQIDLVLSEEYASLLKGILLGDNSEISEEVEEGFRITNISHVLAVSGMHVSYLIAGISIVFKSIIGKRKTKIITIIFLIFYSCITGFSPSVVRASIMGGLVMGAGIIYRKNDIWNSIAISLFIILIYNPFLIKNIGLQFSYMGTIGIILFNKNILEMFKNIKMKNKKYKYRINRNLILALAKIKEILSITFSAQIAILPIMIYNFNIFGTYFFITNLVVSFIIGPIIILGAIMIIISFILFPIAKIISIFLQILLQFLILISSISELPISKIYISTPKIWQVILYYCCVLIFNFIYNAYNHKKINYTQIRVKNLIALARYQISKNKKKYYIIITVLILGYLILQQLPGELEVNFIDVGQGDSCFIITPKNKTILIDGGGSSSDSFDVGKSVLLPYILDKGYTKIDYIFISHFDQDHCRSGYCTLCRR